MNAENRKARRAVVMHGTAPDKADAVPAEFHTDGLEILWQAVADLGEGAFVDAGLPGAASE